MSDQTNPTTDQPGLSLQRKIDVLEFDAAVQRRAIIRLENQVDRLVWREKLLDWTVPPLIGAVAAIMWIVLTK